MATSAIDRAQENIALLKQNSADNLASALKEYAFTYSLAAQYTNRRVYSLAAKSGAHGDSVNVYAEFEHEGSGAGGQRWSTRGKWKWSVMRGREARYVDEIYIEMARMADRQMEKDPNAILA